MQAFINKTQKAKTKCFIFVKKNRRVSGTTLKAFAYHSWYAYHSLGTTELVPISDDH